MADISKQISVKVEARDEHGTVYNLDYSMGLSDNGNWQVQNIIVDGVNLGLSYRSQFDSALNTYAGDVNRVIENWDVFWKTVSQSPVSRYMTVLREEIG